MKQKLQSLLRLSLKPAPRHTTLFNGQLLDQKRDDVYVVMHQMGLIRCGTSRPSKEVLMTDPGIDPQGAHAATRGLPRLSAGSSAC